MARGSIEKLAAVGYLGGSLEHTISGIGCGQREQWHWEKTDTFLAQQSSRLSLRLSQRNCVHISIPNNCFLITLIVGHWL